VARGGRRRGVRRNAEVGRLATRRTVLSFRTDKRSRSSRWQSGLVAVGDAHLWARDHRQARVRDPQSRPGRIARIGRCGRRSGDDMGWRSASVRRSSSRVACGVPSVADHAPTLPDDTVKRLAEFTELVATAIAMPRAAGDRAVTGQIAATATPPAGRSSVICTMAPSNDLFRSRWMRVSTMRHRPGADFGRHWRRRWVGWTSVWTSCARWRVGFTRRSSPRAGSGRR
jgi:hypothetical protein